MSNPTGVIPIGSDLKRKAWIKEGLVQAASKSFWTPYTGMSSDSIIYQKNDLNAGNGQNVVFDYDGFLSGEGFRGFEQAFGKGESKRKFSSTLNIEFGRYSVDNGNKFNASSIDALNLTNHSDSRAKLADLWVRNKDQAIFDTAQGFLRGEAPTHRIELATFTYNDLLAIENTIKTGRGYDVGSNRMPVMPVNGVYYLIIDSFAALKLKQDTNFQTLMSRADLRGAKNKLFTGELAQIGALKVIEAPNFFGVSSSNKLFKSAVEISGMRTLDASGNFQGSASYDGTAVTSRCMLLGKSAMQLAFGQMPDYKFKNSQDFDITSQSAMEIWYNTKKVQLLAEDEDYTDAKVAGHSFGVVSVDITI